MGRTKRSRKRTAYDKLRNINVSASDPIVELLRWMKVSQWKAVCEMQATEFAPLGLRGIMAKHKIDSSDTIVRIPMNLLVTRETAISFLEQSNLFCSSLHIFNQTTTLELLAMFLLINKMSVKLSIKCDQFWKPYIDTLPESYEVPYFCNDDEVN